MQHLWKSNAEQQKFVVSYSGGKDSTLALYHAMQVGTAIGLIVMLEEHGLRSHSHAMPLEIIHAQAEALGLPILSAASNWDNYQTEFLNLLAQIKQHGAETLVTGDLDMPEHGCWHERMTQHAALKLCMPLWQRAHAEVIREFIALNFKSMIVTVNLKLGMRIEDLGKILTLDYIQTLEQRGIDPCGEGGEFHSTVLDGPIFKRAICVRQGEIVRHEHYAFLTLQLDHNL